MGVDQTNCQLWFTKSRGKHTSQKELSFSALSDMMVLEHRIGLICPKKPAQYYTLYSETSTLYPVLYQVPRNQHPFHCYTLVSHWYGKHYYHCKELAFEIYLNDWSEFENICTFRNPTMKTKLCILHTSKGTIFYPKSEFMIDQVCQWSHKDRVYTAKSENVWNWCNLSKIAQVVISAWLGTTWGLNQSFVCVSKLWRERVSVS